MYNEALSRSFNFPAVVDVMGEIKIVETKDFAYRFVKILSLDVSFTLFQFCVYLHIGNFAVCLVHAKFLFFFLET